MSDIFTRLKLARTQARAVLWRCECGRQQVIRVGSAPVKHKCECGRILKEQGEQERCK